MPAPARAIPSPAPDAPGLLPARRRLARRGARFAALVGLLAAQTLAASSESLDLADFNAATQPPGFAAALDVAPEVRDALLRQAIGDDHAPAADPPEAWTAAPQLIAVRLTIPGAAPAGAGGGH